MRSSVAAAHGADHGSCFHERKNDGNLSGPRLAFGGAVFHPYTIGLKRVSFNLVAIAAVSC